GTGAWGPPGGWRRRSRRTTCERPPGAGWPFSKPRARPSAIRESGRESAADLFQGSQVDFDPHQNDFEGQEKNDPDLQPVPADVPAVVGDAIASTLVQVLANLQAVSERLQPSRAVRLPQKARQQPPRAAPQRPPPPTQARPHTR